MATLAALAPEPRQAPVVAAPSSPLDASEPPNGALWVQNMVEINPAAITISARFYDATGLHPFSRLLLNPPPRPEDILRIGKLEGELPPGQYAAHVAPDNPFPSAALVRNDWPATGAAVSYGAVPADAGVTIPWVARRHGSARASSRVSIENTRDDRPVTTTIQITALGASAPALSLTRIIPAGTAAELDLARDPELASLPEGFAGTLHAAVVPGRRPDPRDGIAASVTTELEASAQAAYADAGTPDAALAARLVAPRVTRGYTEARGDGTSAKVDSFIAVANPGAAPAKVTVTYRGSDVAGNACAGQTLVHGGGAVDIPAGGGAVFAQGDGLVEAPTAGSGLPDNCLATAVISSDGTPLAATVVEVEDGSRRAGAYGALDPAASKRIVYVPLLRHGWEGLSTSVYVMNAGDQVTVAQIKIVVVAVTAPGVGDPARTITVTRTASLEPGASASWDLASVPEIPAGAVGAAEVTAARAGVPLVAVARETSDDGSQDNTLFDAVVEPAHFDNPSPAPDEYFPYYAPSVWHSQVYELGVIAAAASKAADGETEVKDLDKALNAQAHDFARRTGRSIAVSVKPYVIGETPNQQLFHAWLRDQSARGFPDVGFQARGWVVGLNFNAVAALGSAGQLVPLDEPVLSRQAEFLDEAWNLTILRPGDRPVAVPWRRAGCSPNFDNLALFATAKSRARGFELMDYFTRPERQRENYQPRSAALSPIGYPTLKPLYTELGISCPALPFVLRSDLTRVEGVMATAWLDTSSRISGWTVLGGGSGANPSKAVGVAAADRFVVAQPMMDPVPAAAVDRLLASNTGLVAGVFSLWSAAPDGPAATPTPTATRNPPVATIVLPYLALRDEGLRGPAFLSLDGSVRRSTSADQLQQGDIDDKVYIVAWRNLPNGSVEPIIWDDTGTTQIPPASLGITVAPVSPTAPKSPEPEAWIQRGSTILCFNVEQHQGCLTIKD